MEKSSEELVIEYQKTGSDSVFSEILEAHNPIIFKIASGISQPSDLDDYYQEGRLGLYKAVQKFDPDRGCKFSTYAYKVIKNSLIGYFKSNLPKEELNHSYYEDYAIPGSGVGIIPDLAYALEKVDENKRSLFLNDFMGTEEVQHSKSSYLTTVKRQVKEELADYLN